MLRNARRLLQLSGLQMQSGFEHRSQKAQVEPSQFEKPPPLNTILNVVPQGSEYIVERLGKYYKTLTPGISFLYPFADKIQYAYCVKEQGFEIPNQFAITADNVIVDIDGILFLRIVDTYKASYNIENPIYNVINFAQTTMRSEIARLSLDNLFKERSALNQNIIDTIRIEANEWGIECKRYEIRDINVSEMVRRSMDLEAEAERKKRKLILDSEGEATAEINRAKGLKEAQQHAADAHQYTVTANAKADGEAIRLRANAVADNIRVIAETLEKEKGSDKAVALRVAEEYIHQFGNLAKTSNTVIMSHPINDPAVFSSQSLAIVDAIKASQKKNVTNE